MLYVEVFINKGQGKFWSIILVLVGLWVPAAINLSGVKNMGVVQVVTSILKFAALAFMSTIHPIATSPRRCATLIATCRGRR